MSTLATTACQRLRPSIKTSFSSTTSEELAHPSPNSLYSNAYSFASSPDIRSHTIPVPIQEEDEYESEHAVEPKTPENIRHYTFSNYMDGTEEDSKRSNETAKIMPDLDLDANAKPPQLAGQEKASKSNAEETKQPLQTRTTFPLRNAVSGLFGRSTSSSSNRPRPTTEGSIIFNKGPGSNPKLVREDLHQTLVGGISVTNSTTTSAATSGSNNPVKPNVPTRSREQVQVTVREPSKHDFVERGIKTRASTFGFRERLAKHFPLRNKKRDQHDPTTPPLRSSTIDSTAIPSSQSPKFLRSSSPNLDLTVFDDDDYDENLEQVVSKSPFPRQVFSHLPESGTGLKSRRLSINAPDIHIVESVELYSEFMDQSKLLGKRGKSLGKGATAQVTLMCRKGDNHDVYAVKEFRQKSKNEEAEDYEKKIKSEYSIAHSVHHPNIVETVRLCTTIGKDGQTRWNHVMEFCEQGDLFTLVKEKYLSDERHKIDRHCLFKQLIQGLNYLHAHGIAHRDIKLENLLICGSGKLKIADFGVSEVFSGVHPGLRLANGECGKDVDLSDIRFCEPGLCGSPPYVAPEVMERKGTYSNCLLTLFGTNINTHRQIRPASCRCLECGRCHALHDC